MEEMSIMAAEAANDPAARESFIKSHETTILKMASSVSGRYIDRSDDEWSVALIAFSKAIDTYDSARGEFAGYARTLIERALIDYHRTENSHMPEISTEPYVLEGSGSPEEDRLGVARAVAAGSMDDRQERMRLELETVQQELEPFGFSFFDLAGNSPTRTKARKQCTTAVRFILDKPERVEHMKSTGRIPAADITRFEGVPLKVLDKYRRYIIMAVTVLAGDYELLSDYLSFMGKECQHESSDH